jgi:hypothetical protein
MTMRIMPWVRAIPKNEFEGEERPRTAVNTVTETDPKNTSAKVPMNSAVYARRPIFIIDTGWSAYAKVLI